MENEPTFFDFAAEVGLTKHIGGVEATEALVELCHIGQGSYVLDVGCGAGVTPCFLARRYGCRVVGVEKERHEIVQLVLKAVGMAMGVASVVLSVLRIVPVETNVMLLGIGVFALGLAALDRETD